MFTKKNTNTSDYVRAFFFFMPGLSTDHVMVKSSINYFFFYNARAIVVVFVKCDNFNA